MIDWSTIDKTQPSDWTHLAELLMQKVVAAIQNPVRQALDELQSDINEFAMRASNRCPTAALVSINTSNRQVASAIAALDIEDLATRNAVFDAAGAKVSVAAGTLREEKQKLELTKLKGAIDQLSVLAAEVQKFRAEISGIAKKDVPDRIDAILKLLTAIQDKARTA